MKIGVIVQARVASTRLPGKILRDLPFGGGVTVLEQVIRRLKRSAIISEIIIATTRSKNDAAVVRIAKNERVNYFRGDTQDVLSRYYFAAKENSLDVFVRVTSDCPCVDPVIVDKLIGEHLKKKADYTSVSQKAALPHGLNAEVVSFESLEKAYFQAHKQYDREHVTPYIYNHSDVFSLNFLKAPEKLHRQDIRITLDREEDYALLCAVFDYLYSKDKYFGAQDIIRLFDKKPWLKLINKDVLQKRDFADLKDELKEAVRLLAMQELRRAAQICRRSLERTQKKRR